MSFMKSLVTGLGYILISPIILAGCAVVAVYGVFNFFVQFFIMVINFFKGKNLFPELPEDAKAYEMLNASYEQQKIQSQNQNSQQGNTYIQQNFYVSPGSQIPNMPGQFMPNSQQFQQVQGPQDLQQISPQQPDLPAIENTADKEDL